MQIKRILLATTAAGALTVAAAGPADARCPDDDPCPTVQAVGTVNVADGYTLGVRPVPRQNARQIRQLRDGGKAYITCQTIGSKVSGTYGTTRIWDHLKKGGYVSDAYVYTGTDGWAAPRC